MYSEAVRPRSAKRSRFVPSLETVCLFFAVGLALTAVIIPLLPKEMLDWVLARIG